jgi:hypothetical protein
MSPALAFVDERRLLAAYQLGSAVALIDNRRDRRWRGRALEPGQRFRPTTWSVDANAPGGLDLGLERLVGVGGHLGRTIR